ncbi:inovirus Gp2 family protein [Enterobacter sp. JMULE2]|uniref:YagK/YfjJ domain-containing protein n=1 Tax=Enterobacter sp. JMULE2 TaxID=2518340 RepID=UPI0015761FF4|nr:inovirus-type Gp2 protein [Enterobacter sp. JMULE2]NTZ39825.1 inovirus Gp2 family protein [Enterobacter sp. JMULE2]
MAENNHGLMSSTETVSVKEKIKQVLTKAFSAHDDIIMVKIILNFPDKRIYFKGGDDAIERFLGIAKERIPAYVITRKSEGVAISDTSIFYLWKKNSDNAHTSYTLLLLLNHDTLSYPGAFALDEGRFFTMIRHCWRSALGMDAAHHNLLLHLTPMMASRLESTVCENDQVELLREILLSKRCIDNGSLYEQNSQNTGVFGWSYD